MRNVGPRYVRLFTATGFTQRPVSSPARPDDVSSRRRVASRSLPLNHVVVAAVPRLSVSVRLEKVVVEDYPHVVSVRARGLATGTRSQRAQSTEQ